jgi:two-component system nitrate/nitrite response regulator NarL
MNDVRNPSHRLVLVDDQTEFLELTRTRLTQGAVFEVVGEATSGDAALALIVELEPAPDAVLLDIEMPGLDGFETARRMRTLAPNVRIILISASDNSRYRAAAEGIGAAFLAKRSLSAEAILRLLD